MQFNVFSPTFISHLINETLEIIQCIFITLKFYSDKNELGGAQNFLEQAAQTNLVSLKTIHVFFLKLVV